MSTKVSVIVPAYNAEAYISDTIKSILNQTLKEIEVIVVNDGSTDNTLSILETIQKTDRRLKIISQANQSVGSARNMGIKNSIGEYVSFVDSDDTIDQSMLESMYVLIKESNSDICVCNYNIVTTKNVVVRQTNYSIKQISFDAILALELNVATWNKLYKRALFCDNKISFLNNVFCEDLATSHELFYFAKSFCFMEKPLYNYLIHLNGASQKITKKNISDIIKSLVYTKKFLESQNIFYRYNLSYYRRVFIQLNHIFNGINYQDTLLKNHFVCELKNSNLLDFLHSSLLEKIILETKNGLYGQLLAYFIATKQIKSIYIYGCNQSFDILRNTLENLEISIQGIIETYPEQKEVLYPYGSLQDFGTKLNNSTILITSISYYSEIKENIEKFIFQNNICINIY